MSKRSKRRRKKRQRYLKKLARRQAHFEAISAKKNNVSQETFSKESLRPDLPANRLTAQGKWQTEKTAKTSQKLPKTPEKLPYLKKDLLKVIIISGIFLIILVILFIIDQKTGILPRTFLLIF